jgi:hypothetical protein
MSHVHVRACRLRCVAVSQKGLQGLQHKRAHRSNEKKIFIFFVHVAFASLDLGLRVGHDGKHIVPALLSRVSQTQRSEITQLMLPGP